ncbi:MAG: hypothetical protein RIC93_00435, partial [Alphaproteobacteria bacterium]
MPSRFPRPLAAAERKSAGAILPQLIVRSAMGNRLLRRIADINCAATGVLVHVPSQSWLSLVMEGLTECAPNAIIEILKSGRHSRLGDKNSNLLDALADGRSAIGITAEPQLVSRDLRAAIDHVVQIERLGVSPVRQAITEVTGQRVRGLSESDIDGLDPVAIMSAIRNCRKAREAVERIRQLRARLSAPQIPDAVPGLDQLPLVGEVRDWANGMRQDLEAVARGTLPMSAVRFGVLEGPPGTG